MLGALCVKLLLDLGRRPCTPGPRWSALTLHLALLTLLATFVVFLTPAGLGIFSAASLGTAGEQRLLPNLQAAAVELPSAAITANPAQASMRWLALDGAGLPLSAAYPAILVAPLLAVSMRQAGYARAPARCPSRPARLACRH